MCRSATEHWGRQHASQYVSLPDLCWAVVVIKEHLWDFVGQYAFHAAPMDLHAELELTRFVNVFFDGMICYFAEGYEQYRSEMVEAQLHGRETAHEWSLCPGPRCHDVSLKMLDRGHQSFIPVVTGSVIQKIAPVGREGFTLMVPPCASIAHLAIGNPSPKPPESRERASSSR